MRLTASPNSTSSICCGFGVDWIYCRASICCELMWICYRDILICCTTYCTNATDPYEMETVKFAPYNICKPKSRLKSIGLHTHAHVAQYHSL